MYTVYWVDIWNEGGPMGIANVLSLLCGVALFLYGMSVMGDGLKRVAGNKLEVILWRLSSTPLTWSSAS